MKKPFRSLSCSEAKKKRFVHWSTFIFDHGHFPLRTIDIDNTTSKEAVSLIINILLPCERERGRGVKFPSLLVLNVKDIGMRTPIITSVIFIIRREKNILKLKRIFAFTLLRGETCEVYAWYVLCYEPVSV